MGRRTAKEVADERVARGAEALDRLRPNWFRAISIEELDLSDPCNCVCGQLARSSRASLVRVERARGLNEYGSWLMYMRDRLSWWFGAADLGFSCGSGTTWGALDAAWKRAIRQRLGATS